MVSLEGKGIRGHDIKCDESRPSSGMLKKCDIDFFTLSAPLSNYAAKYPDCPTQNKTRPVHEAQLIAEVKSMYAGFTMVETKRRQFDQDNTRSSDAVRIRSMFTNARNGSSMPIRLTDGCLTCGVGWCTTTRSDLFSSDVPPRRPAF